MLVVGSWFLYLVNTKVVFRRPQVKRLYDVVVIHMPFVRDIVYDTQRAWFLDSLVLLVRGGMPLVPASFYC